MPPLLTVGAAGALFSHTAVLMLAEETRRGYWAPTVIKES